MFLTTTKSYISLPFISFRKISSSFSKPKLWNIVPSSSTEHLSLGLSISARNMSVSCTYSSENGSHSHGSTIQVQTWWFLFFYLFVLFHIKNYEFLFDVLFLKFLKLFMVGVVNDLSHTLHLNTHLEKKLFACTVLKEEGKKIRNLIFGCVMN